MKYNDLFLFDPDLYRELTSTNSNTRNYNVTPEDYYAKPKCAHEWKETRLVISSVFDCKKCGVKKEDLE